MSDSGSGYRDVPEEDRRKAQVFFDKAKTVGDAGQYDFAISMYLQGLEKDPENVDAHKALRELSLKRKASGGKKLGMFDAMKLKKASKDDKETLLNAEKVLSYDPGDLSNMVTVMQAAHKAGYYDSVMWIGRITMEANVGNPKGPDYKTFITLKDIYKSLNLWKEAAEACTWAAKLKPDDMDLQKEAKDIGAQQTMSEGKYGVAKSFRESVRDMDKQQELMERDTDVRTVDAMKRQLASAEAEYLAEPNEPGKINKYVDVLRKTESMEHENKAIEILEDAFKRTSQFRFRRTAGEIKLRQLTRMEQGMVQELRKNPADEDLKKQIQQFRRERMEEELKEFSLWAENYPTETIYRYNMAQRMFALEQFDECIQVFQQVRQDPKYKSEAGVLLGRAFMQAGFMDEAVDTLREVTDAYQIKGDEKSIEMTYYYARALEAKGEIELAKKAYSQVAQWNFGYRDVQARIKSLRTQPKA